MGFGVFLGLTKNLSKLEARGIYYGLPDTVVAVKATGLMEGKPSFIGGGEYKLDKATKVKVVVTQSGDIKAGMKKSLRSGCFGFAVESGDEVVALGASFGFAGEASSGSRESRGIVKAVIASGGGELEGEASFDVVLGRST